MGKKALTVLLVFVSVFLTGVLAYVAGSEASRLLQERRHRRSRRDLTLQTNQILAKMQTIKVGDTLGDFTFEDIDGHPRSLRELAQGTTVISYISPDCGACINELEELHKAVSDSEEFSHFLLISSANPLHLRDLREQFDLQAVMLYDEERAFATGLGIFTAPFNMVVDGSLRITDIKAGQMYREDFEDIIRSEP